MLLPVAQVGGAIPLFSNLIPTGDDGVTLEPNDSPTIKLKLAPLFEFELKLLAPLFEFELKLLAPPFEFELKLLFALI